MKLSELVSLMEDDRSDIDSKYFTAKKALQNLEASYKTAGKQEQADIVLGLIDDLYEMYVNVEKYKQRKGIK